MTNAAGTTRNQAFVVAVAGGSGSGKTTLVRRLVAALAGHEVLVLELDHYYRDLSHLEPAARDRVNFDHPDALELDLLHRHLEALQRGASVARPVYDFPTHTRKSATVALTTCPVVIVDGILALFDARVNALADLKVFVDADDDLRLARRIRRDIEERGRTLESTVSQYTATVKPMYQRFIAPTRQAADIVIPWNSYNDRAVAFLARAVKLSIGADLSC